MLRPSFHLPSFFCLSLALLGGTVLTALDSHAKGASQCEVLFASNATPIKLGSVQWKSDDDPASKFSRLSGIFTSADGSTKGLKMAFDYSRIRSKSKRGHKTVILLHGVGDNRKDMSLLGTELEQKGWDVVNVDLLDHGETGQLNPTTSHATDFNTQVKMVSDLIVKLKIRKITVIGHSMGGGLSMSVANELTHRSVTVTANIPVAPYLSSIDKFLSQQATTPEVWLFYAQKALDQVSLGSFERMQTFLKAWAPMTGGLMISASENYVRIWQSLFQKTIDAELAISDSTVGHQLRRAFDAANEPALRMALSKMFLNYENLKNEALPEAERKSPQTIQREVEGAVNSTMGLRDLDFQNRFNPSPREKTVPTLIFFGDKDNVVIQPQIEDFKRQVEGQDVSFVKVAGDHHLPQKLPQELATAIDTFITERGLDPYFRR